MSRSEEASWNLLDALDWRGINASTETTSPGENELIPGSTFKSWEKQSSREPWEDMEIPNFPDLDVLPDGQRTSEPVSKVVVETEKKDLLDLVTRERLRELLDAPMGMVRFEEWLEDEGQQGSAALLRYYKDVHAQAQLMDEVRAISHGLRSIYFDHPEGYAFKGFTHGPTQSLSALGDAVETLNRAEDEVLDRLYETEFKRFISGRITDQARACLGSFADQTDRGDLGEIFCLADPRQLDTPLVYVSDGFCELSEYPRNRLVGRNCRFLQGPGTDQEAVRLLREAIAAGKEHTSLLLNYTRTGKPFWNLLNMIPLRNAKGEIDFYLGAQINVTRTLTSKQTFEALTGMVERNQPDVTPKYEISDDVLSAMERITKGSSTFRHISGIASPRSATSPRATSPNPGAMSSLSLNLGVPGEQPQKGHKWLKPKRSFNSIRAGLTTSVDQVDVGAQPAEITQEVESAVKEHMANFAAVYSKMLVFKASDRSIGYVTPALLAYLGYSIKSPSDRFASPLISTDVLDLLTSPSSAETTITRQTVSKSITEHTPHSFFAGLKSRSRTGAQGVEMDGMARGLIHMTPVKDEKDVVVYYVMVVG